jgi:putative ISSpo3, transposase
LGEVSNLTGRDKTIQLSGYRSRSIIAVDEFTIGGKEEGKQGRSYDTKKKKVLCAMELTDPRQSKALLRTKNT